MRTALPAPAGQARAKPQREVTSREQQTQQTARVPTPPPDLRSPEKRRWVQNRSRSTGPNDSPAVSRRRAASTDVGARNRPRAILSIVARTLTYPRKRNHFLTMA